jgi:hypothetical protein
MVLYFKFCQATFVPSSIFHSNLSQKMTSNSSLSRFYLIGMLAFATLFGVLAFKSASPKPATFEYRQFSTIESILPGGLGRSRVVSTDANGTTVEKDLLNFYSLVGINFGNISNNDRLIVDKINEYTNEGWELHSVTTGVQSPTDSGKSGIFITRYLFRKSKG